MIELQNASVNFGELTALKPLSVLVQQGERIALLGANGSGKSTLLRLLHGQQAPSSGTRVKTADAREVMVFQQPFMLRLSALNNVRLGLWFAGWTWQNATTDARRVLSELGFGDMMHKNARAMSVGQRQRLALVRAWALRPDILFLDEPTASLDPTARKEVEQLIARFADAGCTLIFSSHNLGQAKRLATRVIYLERGELLVDLPKDVFFDKSKPNAAEHFLQSERI